MIISNLKHVLEQNRNQNYLFLRNLLKEQLQFYVLNFVYNSAYGKKFLFKGGTALRFCFDLPRLSEDLDFDVDDFPKFDFDRFTADLRIYFQTKLVYKDVKIKVSGVNRIIYLQFPILQAIGLVMDLNTSQDNNLFVRIDVAPIEGQDFNREISLQSTADFSFLINRYSLPDLYAGKLAAIVQRQRWQGTTREARFKGRDYFDIFWLESRGIKPNWQYLQSLLNMGSKTDILMAIDQKLTEAVKRKTELKQDLMPFFRQPEFVNNFIDNIDVFAQNFNPT